MICWVRLVDDWVSDVVADVVVVCRFFGRIMIYLGDYFDGCFCVMDVSVLTRLAGVSHGKTMYILRESSVF